MRHKNANWNLTGPIPGNWHEVITAVLMDIRDELQLLNERIQCNDFIRIPYTLQQIEINTKKRKRKTK